MPASLENGAAVLRDVPSFVSARAANTIISEDRPTRIQAETLLVLNGLLDELLLLILASAKSLATDRIKSDGMLKVLSNNLLAKDAVLEAELELRSYVDGKRAEGAKVPLGLMATSRLDGTDGFPVQSAFKALRLRCQFYSTLGDCDDDGLAKDQNIMSTDGRPIATVTQGVAIYVTALLEYIGQHVLQNVSRVIERDNSDEASLYDLRAAIIEDEQLNPLYNKMAIKQELARRIDILEARRRKRTEDGARSGVRSDARVVKPWHVPTEGDFDEAAGPTLFSAKRASVQQPLSTASSSRHGHAASSSLGHADSSSLRASTSTLRTSSSIANHNAPESSSLVSSTGGASAQSNSRSSPARNASGTTSRSEASTGSIGRRQSSDRSWSGMFGSMKRRGSFKQGSDPNGTAGRPFLQPDAASLQASQSGSALDPDDDFEALMLSNQTMKVSLTPNRLHTIEVAKKGDDANLGSVRRRPGTAGLRDEAAPQLAHSARHPALLQRSARKCPMLSRAPLMAQPASSPRQPSRARAPALRCRQQCVQSAGLLLRPRPTAAHLLRSLARRICCHATYWRRTPVCRLRFLQRHRAVAACAFSLAMTRQSAHPRTPRTLWTSSDPHRLRRRRSDSAALDRTRLRSTMDRAKNRRWATASARCLDESRPAARGMARPLRHSRRPNAPWHVATPSRASKARKTRTSPAAPTIRWSSPDRYSRPPRRLSTDRQHRVRRPRRPNTRQPAQTQHPIPRRLRMSRWSSPTPTR